jgi:hypothetical protein
VRFKPLAIIPGSLFCRCCACGLDINIHLSFFGIRSFQDWELRTLCCFCVKTKVFVVESEELTIRLHPKNVSQSMAQPTLTSPASTVSGSQAAGVPLSPSPQPAAFLGQSVIPLVNKLQDIFSQLGSASTVDLPQVENGLFVLTFS